MSAPITEKTLRENPILVQAFTDLPSEVFWESVERMKAQYPEYKRERLDRPDRQRAIGGGRDFDQPLVIRIAQLLSYMRLHIPQCPIALLFGGSQADVSRDMRRLLPLMQQVLPCPEVWRMVDEGEILTEAKVLEDVGKLPKQVWRLDLGGLWAATWLSW